MEILKRRRKGINLVAIVVLYAGVAVAQNSEVVTELAPVEVTEKSDEYSRSTSDSLRTRTPILDSSQSLQVVPRAVIEDQNSQYLGDTLKNVSGVQLDYGFNGSAQPLTILRGFPSNSWGSGSSTMQQSSNYYLDGTKVTGVPINMLNTESIEVIKGPSSILFGRSEPGGTINVVSKSISARRLTSFTQTVGSYDLVSSSLETTGALNESKSLSARVGGSYSTSESVRDYVEDKLSAFSAGLQWANGKTLVKATVDYMDQRYRSDLGVPSEGNRPKDLPWSRQFNDSPLLSYAKTSLVKLDIVQQLRGSWEIKAKALNVESKTLEADIVTRRTDWGKGPTPSDTCNASGNPLCRYYFGYNPDGRYGVWQTSVDLTGGFFTGRLRHNALVGVDGYWSQRSGTSYGQQVSSVDVNDPRLGHTLPPNSALGTPVDRAGRNDWLSIYAQDELYFTERFIMTTALRYDDTNTVTGGANRAPVRQAALTPRVGFLWKLDENQSLYTQYQEALSANNGRDNISGEALKPERAREYEAGYKFSSDDNRLNATIAVFDLTKYDKGNTEIVGSPPVTRRVTTGESRSCGVEFDISGQLTSKFALIGSYAYIDAKVLKDRRYSGKEQPNVAKQSGSIWGRYFLTSQWTAGAGAFGQGERQKNPENTIQLPGYIRYDLMLAYGFKSWGNKSALQLNVDNLLNTKYYTGSHQFVEDWIRVGSPRTFRLTYRLDI
ncbi:MAG: TonB-dependent siderophore receptor [Bdellovibrionales bacterium]|nr:TonB-dependent siderophore receptor [Bdellovibrionales bacterium]